MELLSELWDEDATDILMEEIQEVINTQKRSVV